MNLVTWSFPTTIVFGVGALSTLADHVKRVGGRGPLRRRACWLLSGSARDFRSVHAPGTPDGSAK
jgi:hypothetical protein